MVYDHVSKMAGLSPTYNSWVFCELLTSSPFMSTHLRYNLFNPQDHLTPNFGIEALIPNLAYWGKVRLFGIASVLGKLQSLCWDMVYC